MENCVEVSFPLVSYAIWYDARMLGCRLVLCLRHTGLPRGLDAVMGARDGPKEVSRVRFSEMLPTGYCLSASFQEFRDGFQDIARVFKYEWYSRDQ